MGDATHDNVAALAAVQGSLQLVAGYVTGTSDIQWTSSDWAQFPGKTLVTIDQGATGSPVPSAIVRDYEPGAWYTEAVVTGPWTPARPTIYCDQTDLPTVLGYGWQGALWLAIIGWESGDALPSAPGCEIVAVQNQQDVNDAYDLSVVLDSTWPNQGVTMLLVQDASDGTIYLISGGKMSHVLSPAAVSAYQNAGIQYIASMDHSDVAQLLNDFPPGNPAVTVNSTVPNLTFTGTVAQESSD